MKKAQIISVDFPDGTTYYMVRRKRWFGFVTEYLDIIYANAWYKRSSDGAYPPRCLSAELRSVIAAHSIYFFEYKEREITQIQRVMYGGNEDV